MTKAEIPTILAVDDEPQILQAIVDLLEDDYIVLTANSGAEALDVLAARSDISVILCDQRMPKMQGSDFFKRAQAISNAARILITGYSDLETVISAVNDGQIYAYISKPFEIEHLRVVIGAARRGYETAVALEDERNLLHGLMESMPDFIYFKDRQGRFLRINRAMSRYLGFDLPESAIGRHEDYLVPADLAGLVNEAQRKILQDGELVVHQINFTEDRTGDKQWWSTVTAPIKDLRGNITALVGIKRDISRERQMEKQVAEQIDRQAELEEANRKIRFDAGHDPLTGLPNRLFLEDRMQQIQAEFKRRNRCVALVYIDLDGFKKVNDTLGHQAGDEVLRNVAAAILPCLRESDVAARLGGDEFIVIGEVDRDHPHEAAEHLAKRILRSINDNIKLADQALEVGCSIGAAIFPNDDQNFDSVMRLADCAMYEAKRAGKNNVVMSCGAVGAGA